MDEYIVKPTILWLKQQTAAVVIACLFLSVAIISVKYLADKFTQNIEESQKIFLGQIQQCHEELKLCNEEFKEGRNKQLEKNNELLIIIQQKIKNKK